MKQITLVKIATYDDPVIAHIARSRLESEEIRAVLDGEHHVAMDWMITNAVGGVKLLVRGSDCERALQILADTKDWTYASNENDGIESDISCPRCGSNETYRERLRRKLIFLSLLLLGVPLPFISRRIVCEECGNRWKPEESE